MPDTTRPRSGAEVIERSRHPASEYEWRNNATCARPEIASAFWYSDQHGEQTIARAICADCPVKTPCLTDGLYDQHGVWAGYSPNERARLARRLPSDPGDVPEFLERAAIFGPRALRVADHTNPDHRKAL